ERQERFERRVDASDSRRNRRTRERRAQLERCAQDLDERAIRDDVAIRTAARPQYSHARVRSQTLLEFIEQSTLPGTSLADHDDCRSNAGFGGRDRLKRRQLRLAA